MANGIVFGKARDFIDADYVVVSPDGREAPVHSNAYEPFAARSGMDMLRERTFVEARDPARGGPLFWAGGIALAALAFWISGGHVLLGEIDNVLPAKPSTHMRIAGWNSQISDTGANPTLMIDGEVVNEGTRAEPMPSLEIEVASANGTRTRYKLGTGDASVDARGTFPFSGRLHLPKDGVQTVSVSFVQ
ncbi:MAG: hypothetical protein M9924_09750 [Rhizobiaceae bacterium]|nr:hypothetical protein [Rhizobiaceae bacterium]